MMIARGSCWLTMTASADSPVQLNTGDCYLMQPDCDFTLQHQLGDDVVSCEGVLTDYDVTHGGEGELTEVIFGRFPVDTDVAQPLFARLPSTVRLDLDGPSCRAVQATFDLLAQATATVGIGTHLIVTRLADILFVQALRAVHASAIDGEAGWLSALHDPQMAPAMRDACRHRASMDGRRTGTRGTHVPLRLRRGVQGHNGRHPTGLPGFMANVSRKGTASGHLAEPAADRQPDRLPDGYRTKPSVRPPP
jgi:hypothetical protein